MNTKIGAQEIKHSGPKFAIQKGKSRRGAIGGKNRTVKMKRSSDE